MGLSQQIGASSLSKPGVCTSTTRPATPYEGQMIYETDTDLTYIYGGSSWQQVSGGTAVGNSGLVYVTSATVGTTVSTVAVASCFSSTYDNYKIIYSGGVGSTTSDLRLVLGSTITGYAYGLIYMASPYSGISLLVNAGTETSFPYSGGTSTNSAAMNLELIDPFKSKYTYMNGTYLRDDILGTTLSGNQRSTTSFTGFTINVGSGTITGGTVTVYGYRKA